MSFPRSLVLAILSVTSTLGLLILGAPQVASATVSAPQAGQGSPDRSGYRSWKGTAPAPDVVSPSGCVQKADYPHASSHYPGRMNGVVRATCNTWVPRISHSAQMWETRWWGWDRIGTKGYVNAYNVKTASTEANDKCRRSTIRVTGSGFVIDIDGRSYYASTESIHVKNPCGL
ncbi:MAG: hypothetical protein QOH10_2837 [Actinomycetota bacterium]|jgi:hypothetical protein|nr:hypothetical protein [Actinomycetota bacterium]